jgi:hypothetical protein
MEVKITSIRDFHVLARYGRQLHVGTVGTSAPKWDLKNIFDLKKQKMRSNKQT